MDVKTGRLLIELLFCLSAILWFVVILRVMGAF